MDIRDGDKWVSSYTPALDKFVSPIHLSTLPLQIAIPVTDLWPDLRVKGQVIETTLTSCVFWGIAPETCKSPKWESEVELEIWYLMVFVFFLSFLSKNWHPLDTQASDSVEMSQIRLPRRYCKFETPETAFYKFKVISRSRGMIFTSGLSRVKRSSFHTNWWAAKG